MTWDPPDPKAEAKRRRQLRMIEFNLRHPHLHDWTLVSAISFVAGFMLFLGAAFTALAVIILRAVF